MNPVIIVVCLLVVACVAFFIAYSEEKRSAKKDNSRVQSFVDDPSVLFEADSKSKKEDEDIEII